MFDVSWTEIVVIGAAALIFIGPKELPGALRTVGRFVSKARQMAREFQGNVEEMVRETELDEIKRQVDKVATGEYTRSIEQQIDPKGDIASALASPSLNAPATMPSASPALSPPTVDEPSAAAKPPSPSA